MAAAYSLTAARLREVLSYDPDTGIFTWRVSRGTAKAGSVAGSPDKDGYVILGLYGRLYKAHRLALFHAYGSMPDTHIDHRNGVPGDNRLSNLRPATRSGNCQNQRCAHSNNVSGLLGVSQDGNRWRAQIQVDGVNRYLGLFNTPELAHAAYLAAKALYHPFQTLVTPAEA
jgi:hypothetical protein